MKTPEPKYKTRVKTKADFDKIYADIMREEKENLRRAAQPTTRRRYYSNTPTFGTPCTTLPCHRPTR